MMKLEKKIILHKKKKYKFVEKKLLNKKIFLEINLIEMNQKTCKFFLI